MCFNFPDDPETTFRNNLYLSCLVIIFFVIILSVMVNSCTPFPRYIHASEDIDGNNMSFSLQVNDEPHQQQHKEIVDAAN